MTEHYIRFNSEITEESVQSLIDEMGQYQYVVLYFSTDGGYITEMNMLIDYLNYRYDTNSLRLILCDEVISAGTLLLTRYNGPIFLDKGFRMFIFHIIDAQAPLVRRSQADRVSITNTERIQKDYLDEIKTLGLNGKELKMVADGKDVVIAATDLSRLKRQFFSGVETVTQYKLIE